MSGAEQMSRRDREDLQKIARMRAKLAKDGVGQREAALRADVEEQLSASFAFDQAVWADITRTAEQAVKEADAQVAAICRTLGVPEQFRPGLSIGWYGRGENATAGRRAELRKLAEARITAAGKAAKVAIDTKVADVLTELIAGGLESGEARAYLDTIPSADALMPTVDIRELEQATPARTTPAREPLW